MIIAMSVDSNCKTEASFNKLYMGVEAESCEFVTVT